MRKRKVKREVEKHEQGKRSKKGKR
jgi:hypothetical protein